MTKHIIGAFKDQGLYWQPPEAVGDIIVALQADSSINGKAYYIEGGDGWEYEDSFYETQPQWLSEEGCRRMRVNAEAVQKVGYYLKTFIDRFTDDKPHIRAHSLPKNSVLKVTSTLILFNFDWPAGIPMAMSSF